MSVQDFGAVGDGITDDTDAILDAIAAMPANGSGLYFPPGTYIVNSDYVNGLKFNGKSNFVLSGYGATIKVKNGAAVTTNHEVMFFINCQNGAINGLTIDGNRANRTITTETASHCLSITDYCSNIVVNDVVCQ
ncbi:MAG: glycosyl hydrolase family 28-related protein, partial [Flammeovirgaceae bacterium]